MKSLEIEGPWRFRLVRTVDPTGISGIGGIADGCRFKDGTCVLRWATATRSTGLYETHETLMAIHGHGGTTVCEWIDVPPSPTFSRAVIDAIQDDCEGCAFTECPPSYIEAADHDEYQRGYHAYMRARFGDDWRSTCARVAR